MSLLFNDPASGGKPHRPRKRPRSKPGFDEKGNPLPIREPNRWKPTCPSGFIINNDFSPFDPINPPYRCKVDKDLPDIDFEKAGQKQFKVKEQERIEPEVEVFAEETKAVSVQEVKANTQKNVKEANAEAAKRRKKYGFSGGTATRKRSRKRSKLFTKNKRHLASHRRRRRRRSNSSSSSSS
jgi:hypothetical protein